MDDPLVLEGVDDRVGDAEVGEGLVLKVLVARIGDVRSGLRLDGDGDDVAESDDSGGVLDGRRCGGRLDGLVLLGRGRALVSSVGRDPPCLPGSPGDGWQPIAHVEARSARGFSVRATGQPWSPPIVRGSTTADREGMVNHSSGERRPLTRGQKTPTWPPTIIHVNRAAPTVLATQIERVRTCNQTLRATSAVNWGMMTASIIIHRPPNVGRPMTSIPGPIPR
ncbi:Uncharacterised protein [Chlamydia trachomatis]|nr:Uncharacterised protein [Chlamydia trachomatis]